ncbi:MAG: ATP-binding protein [Nitrospira sp.]|nr:ATP-binding protein [Nitrospira sp.]
MDEQLTTVQDFSVRIHFEKILETISTRIYDSQYAFLRENVQNAIDAIRIQATRDGMQTDAPKYRIDVRVKKNQCEIQDNGIGMTKEELSNNFWTMGASGKTTAEARAAGCIGFFGIGGFANFGVCDTLEVISRCRGCDTAHFTSLSRSAFREDNFQLPRVTYRTSDELTSHGTIIRGIGKTSFDPKSLETYLKQFVRYVKEPIFFQNELVSQESAATPRANYRELTEEITWKAGDVKVTFQLLADDGNNLAAKIFRVTLGAQRYECTGDVRLVHGQVDVYKRGFRLCAVTISSRIGVSGKLDTDFLQPTAGRDSLDSKSQTLLGQVFQIIETASYQAILDDPDLLENHIRLLSELVAKGHLEKLGQLSVKSIDGRIFKLADLQEKNSQGNRIFYSLSGNSTPATEVLQARGHVILALSSNRDRRNAEIAYLRSYCSGEQFDNLIECIEPYEKLERFDQAVLAELDFAIKRLFNPSPYSFVAGKLTLDAPIYWSDKKDGGKSVVFVDTRHGEFLKLKPLGFSGLFWSMIEAFCREYLGDTLKRQSPKFFGSGAIDLDSYSKSHGELWELVATDIEISRIESPESNPSLHQRTSHIEVVRASDVVRVTISTGAGVKTEQIAADEISDTGSKQSPPKLLRIIDETKVTGLEGYYLRIPETATKAFGDLLRTFPTFVLVWFANRITWQGSDLQSTAFLLDITLDRLIQSPARGELAHGTVDLGPSKIQTYNGQIYFFIDPAIQEHLVPKNDKDLIKIDVRHELLDLGKPRSWTSKSNE